MMPASGAHAKAFVNLRSTEWPSGHVDCERSAEGSTKFLIMLASYRIANYNFFMGKNRLPSAKDFVIRAVDESAETKLADLAGRLGFLKVLEGPEQVHVLCLAGGDFAPREAWEGLSQVLSPEFAVDPVLVDELGHSHYPTGRIIVRFVSEPDESDVVRFGGQYDLQPCERNKFVRSQISFRSRKPTGRYLPDLIETLKRDPKVVSAWPETLSRYDRI
jgi:hypothetical protein